MYIYIYTLTLSMCCRGPMQPFISVLNCLKQAQPNMY